MALDVSAYSLVACARAAEPLFETRGGGSILTMTYLGGERAVPHYNVMGVAKATLDASVRYLAWDLGQKNIRVNAISAGPVRTLAARSIAASRRWRRSSRSARRYTGTSTPMTSARRRPISSRTTPGTSRGRRCTWTPGITLWGCSHPQQLQPDLAILCGDVDQMRTSTVTRCQPRPRTSKPGAVDGDAGVAAETERSRESTFRSRRSRTVRASRSCSGRLPCSRTSPDRRRGANEPARRAWASRRRRPARRARQGPRCAARSNRVPAVPALRTRPCRARPGCERRARGAARSTRRRAL